MNDYLVEDGSADSTGAVVPRGICCSELLSKWYNPDVSFYVTQIELSKPSGNKPFEFLHLQTDITEL